MRQDTYYVFGVIHAACCPLRSDVIDSLKNAHDPYGPYRLVYISNNTHAVNTVISQLFKRAHLLCVEDHTYFTLVDGSHQWDASIRVTSPGLKEEALAPESNYVYLRLLAHTTPGKESARHMPVQVPSWI